MGLYCPSKTQSCVGITLQSLHYIYIGQLALTAAMAATLCGMDYLLRDPSVHHLGQGCRVHVDRGMLNNVLACIRAS